MTVDEIFNKIIMHMIEGIMQHDEMAKIYDFLGLYGYSQCQNYHYIEESEGYRHLSHYYATHYFKLLIKENIEQPKLFPESWYKYTTMAIDIGTKRMSIKDCLIYQNGINAAVKFLKSSITLWLLRNFEPRIP